jgi:hypothetical protein
MKEEMNKVCNAERVGTLQVLAEREGGVRISAGRYHCRIFGSW